MDVELIARKKMCQLYGEVCRNIDISRLQKGEDGPFTSLGILNCH
jgi:hypothetical protein